MLKSLGRGDLYYGWVVVGVTALALLVSAGVRSAPGVFIYPLEVDLGWGRAAVSFAVAIGLVLYGLAGPAAGWLIDRHGARLLTAAGLLLMGLSTLASAAMTSLWQLDLLWGILSGVGTGTVATVLGATVANRWFVARRGLVMGIFGASVSAGQLIFVPLLMYLVLAIGWRGAALALGGVVLLVLAPVVLLMRNDPGELGLRPYGARDGAGGAQGAVEAGSVMRRALRRREFWLLSASFFICGATSNGLVGTHLIPHAIDHNIPEVAAAGILGLMGTMNFVGTVASGWLTDRYSPRGLLAIYYSFRGLSLFLLPFVSDDLRGLAVFAVVFGLDYIATVPPTAALVADTFGRRNVGAVFGWVFCAHQIGAALSASLGGLAREALGDYALAFVAAGALALIAAALSMRIGRGSAAPRPGGAEARP